MLDDPFGAEKNAAKEELVAARETELVASERRIYAVHHFASSGNLNQWFPMVHYGSRIHSPS